VIPMTLRVEKRAAGIAVVDCGVSLNEVGERRGTDITVVDTDDPGRDRSAEARRVADRQHRIAGSHGTCARICFASGRVSPRFAISPMSRGRLTSITSIPRLGLSTPGSTNRKTHPIHDPQQATANRSYGFRAHPPTF